MLLVYLFRVGPYLWEQWRLGKAGLPQIDRMTGLEFEKYLEILFRRLGYQVERTRYAGDQGGDLVLTKDGERILVQAKRYSKAVGNKAVQEVAAARPHYKCHKAMVVANRPCTQAARESAASNHIDLWDRNKLAKVILSLQAPPQPVSTVPAPSAQAEPATRMQTGASSTPVRSVQPEGAGTPTCSRCSKPMVLRNGSRGQFWGCANFPRCRNTLPFQEASHSLRHLVDSQIRQSD